MTERCTNCGSELFAGQMFCRRCGARTAPLEGEAPTRILPDAAGAPPPAAGTTALPTQRGTGEAMWGPRHTGPQTPFANFAHTSPLPAGASAAPPQGTATAALAPAQRGRRWLVPALFALLIVAAVGGALAVVMFSVAPRQVVRIERGGPPAPPAPPGLPAPGGSLLDESGAVVTAEETVLTKSFELPEDASFSLRNTQGDITVEGWDEERVELKVTKRGGSASDRESARLTLRQTDESFELAAGNSPVKVFFEVRLPRSLGKVEISSRSGAVKVAQVSAPLSVSLQNGDVELDDVRGPVDARLVNGDLDVIYRGGERDGAQEFTNVNGDVTVRLAEGMDADLTASIVNGQIDVDGRLGFQPQKRQPGWHVDTRLGDGGEPVTVKGVNGSIRFKR